MVTTWPIGTKNENWNFLRRFWCRFWWNFRSKIENLLEIMLNCFINNKRNIIIYRNSFNTQMKTSTMFIFRKSKLYYSTHYRNFCDFLKFFEKILLKTLKTRKYSRTVTLFWTFFVTVRDWVLHIIKKRFL